MTALSEGTVRGNRALSRALDILELLMISPGGVSLADISRELRLPKTSAFDLLTTLLDRGYVEPVREGGKTYRLGYKAFQVGYAYQDSVSIRSVSRTLLAKLSQGVSKTAFLATLRDGQVVYLDKCEPDGAYYLKAAVGSLQPAYCTGLGKAMLATLSRERIVEMLGPGPYDAKTPHTLTSLDSLLNDLSETRERGYAIDRAENEAQILCYAAPIRNYENSMVGAVSVAGLKVTYSPQQLMESPVLVCQTAMHISHALGFQGNALF